MFWRIAGGAALGLVLYWLLFLVLGVGSGLLWGRLPDWYNLTIPVVITGFFWFGSQLALAEVRRSGRKSDGAAPQLHAAHR